MSAETLTQFYADDHRRLDELFAAFQNLKPADPKRVEMFRQFRSGLEQHMAWEEAILFSEYDARTAEEGRDRTKDLRFEHEELRGFMGDIEDKMRKGDFKTQKDEDHLFAMLAAHNFTEENGFYQKVDELLTDEERARIFTRMKEAAL